MKRWMLTFVGLLIASPAMAQQFDSNATDETEFAERAPATSAAPVTRTVDTGNGQIGQRQTRQDATPSTMPFDRVDNRVSSRVQNRIRNRIDRYYDPQANATSPFTVASDQARRRTTQPR